MTSKSVEAIEIGFSRVDLLIKFLNPSESQKSFKRHVIIKITSYDLVIKCAHKIYDFFFEPRKPSLCSCGLFQARRATFSVLLVSNRSSTIEKQNQIQ